MPVEYALAPDEDDAASGWHSCHRRLAGLPALAVPRGVRVPIIVLL